MTCRHSLTGSPSTCSQCIGITPRAVNVAGTTVDGEPAPPKPDRMRHYRAKGGMK